MVLDKTPESPLDCKEINQSTLKEISPEYSLEGLKLKLKLQYFGHLMQRTDSLEKTMMLGKIEGRSRRGRQRMRWLNDIITSMMMSSHEIEQTLEYREGRGSQAWCSPWVNKELDTTEQLSYNSNHGCVKATGFLSVILFVMV